EEDADIELHVCGLAWEQSGKHRTLMYNVTVPLVRNNIDLILLNSTPEEFSNAYKDPHRYIALGELKGGIDPAGADEHWKTAKTALARIRSAFEAEALNPMTFFVGAAVAKKMADEIWDDLQTQRLSNSANLTSPDQVASLCNWITQL
ncbi:MAG TPA: AvaI/BsoBI family type II restriction endonuclease, partial [Candidatus Angelobacter sp.]|nr:AvaI/BsoBI family type II restriction endonuclease [Candidatus Angelobacter sp.]